MDVRVALDTNRLTDLFQGDAELADRLGKCDEVWIPLVVLAEMKAGFLGGSQQYRNEALLQTFLGKPTVGILLPARETAEHYARLFVQLKRAGTPIPDNDLWIAACAIRHSVVLVSNNRRHFQNIPELSLLSLAPEVPPVPRGLF